MQELHTQTSRLSRSVWTCKIDIERGVTTRSLTSTHQKKTDLKEVSRDSIKITRFGYSAASTKVKESVGLQLQANGISVALNAHWHYREDSWPHISDSGSADMTTSGTSLNVVIHFGAADTGRPTMSDVKSCSAHIGHVDVTFHGGASWLYNLFSSSIADNIKDALRDEICRAVEGKILSWGEESLAEIRVSAPVGDFADLDLGLIENPKFHTNSIELLLKGDVVPRNSTFTMIPIEGPDPIPEVADTTHMMYVDISEYVVNAIAFMYHEAGKLRKSLTQKDAGKQYPNKGIQLVMNTTQPSHISILPGQAELTVYGNVHVYAMLPHQAPAHLFSINVTMALDAKEVKLVEERLHWNVSIDSKKVKINIFNSTVGPVPSSKLDFGVPIVCKFAESWANNYLEEGIPVFQMDNMKFLNGQVKMNKGYISIGTDVLYTGKP